MIKVAKGAVTLSCVLAVGVGSFSLTGCASQGTPVASDAGETETSATQGAYTFTDDLGREVTVASHNRVVAGMGSFANVWELAGGTLVGASDDAFSDYHIASDAQKIGDFSSLNAESIIALNPDFVILTGPRWRRCANRAGRYAYGGEHPRGIFQGNHVRRLSAHAAHMLRHHRRRAGVCGKRPGSGR